MKASRSERKKKVEMVRKETNTVIKKLHHLGCNGAKLYMVIEFNGKYSIFDSCPDKNWRLSDKELVSSTIIMPPLYVLVNSEQERYYPLPKKLIRRKSVEK
jgi:hypothetical protein